MKLQLQLRFISCLVPIPSFLVPSLAPSSPCSFYKAHFPRLPHPHNRPPERSSSFSPFLLPILCNRISTFETSKITPKKGGRMCSSKTSSNHNQSGSLDMEQPVARINGRPVLQPTCNRLERRGSLKKTTSPAALTKPTTRPRLSPSPPISPKTRSPIARTDLSGGVDKLLGTNSPLASKSVPPVQFKRLGKVAGVEVEAAGSIAAARREEVANLQVLRKKRIAHYGRAKKSVNGDDAVDDSLPGAAMGARLQKRCDFITPNSDPVYATYHDEEWGVPVHDDKLLFELLMLTAAQVGSDWTSVLKRREHFRDAFSGFDASMVATFGERRVVSISCDYGIELSQVRGAVENAKQILKIREEYGSFDKYLWRFVNFNPISTQYRTCRKIPVKTSKSEAISKDLVKRGFRFVGPAVIHSLMQAAGLTNDHLISCPRHLRCTQLALQGPDPTHVAD
ncbi:hypothetical protein Dimus_015621 [Dionaea muscipula]